MGTNIRITRIKITIDILCILLQKFCVNSKQLNFYVCYERLTYDGLNVLGRNMSSIPV